MDDMTVLALVAAAFVVGYTLGGMSSRSKTPAEPLPPPDMGALERVRPILERDGKIAAIKAYREATGTGLREAKLAVDTLATPA